MTPLPRLPDLDLEELAGRLEPCWRELAGARILFTGCTGFFGPWLLEPLLAAEARLGLGLRAWVLTRDPAGFRRRLPHLANHPALELLEGDVRTFSNPGVAFTHLVHGAGTANSRREPLPPEVMEATLVAGTRQVLAAAAGVDKALFISSGAVYGPQPPGLARLAETQPLGMLPPGYGEGKRQAEALCAQAAFPVTIARCFAFLAPHLPLDAHFAAGNFLAAALAGQAPTVLGDGRAERSYLYGTDLAVWLYTLLLRGEPGRAYNVGSETAVSILQLAEAIAVGQPVAVLQSPAPGPPARYLPDTSRARHELGLTQTVTLAEAIDRTLAWHHSILCPEVP